MARMARIVVPFYPHHVAQRGNRRQRTFFREADYSAPMDESYLVAAVRYVERNPVAASLCRRAEDWPWSSARAHLRGRDDVLVAVGPMLSLIDDWSAYLSGATDAGINAQFVKHSQTGRPLGDARFIRTLERITGRVLSCRPPGRKKKAMKK